VAPYRPARPEGGIFIESTHPPVPVPSPLRSFEAGPTVYVKNQPEIRGTISTRGFANRPIEVELLEGRIDLAVHSLKDVPSDAEASGLALSAFTAREDPRDALVSRTGSTLAQLASGDRVGTSSLRRRAQLLDARPDLEPKDIRGNVDSRLRKLDEGEFDALLLAAAGLRRLGQAGSITEGQQMVNPRPRLVRRRDGAVAVFGVRSRELVNCPPSRWLTTDSEPSVGFASDPERFDRPGQRYLGAQAAELAAEVRQGAAGLEAGLG